MEEINFEKVMVAQDKFRKKLDELKESTERLGERISEMEDILHNWGK